MTASQNHLVSLSVVMSVYNDAPFVGQAIESILGQTVRDFEFLIVDDGSNDSSGAIIERFAAQDARIRVIRQENRGLLASLNRLIGEAKGALIARMDSDDISLPERFACQIAYLDAHPACVVLGTNFHHVDARDTVHEVTARHPSDHEEIMAAMAGHSPICHPTVMMRRQAVIEAGGYRVPFHHCEDFDLWLRMSHHGRLANLPDRLLHYRRTSGQISVNHAVTQRIGAMVALLAYEERLAGRPDPTMGLAQLPSIEQLDSMFGRSDATRTVLAQIAKNAVYSVEALHNGGLDHLRSYVRDGGDRGGLGRAVVRMAMKREWSMAANLFALMISI